MIFFNFSEASSKVKPLKDIVPSSLKTKFPSRFMEAFFIALGCLVPVFLNIAMVRKGKDINIIDIHTSKPGLILGKGGEGISKFRELITKEFNKKFIVNVVENSKPDLSAKLLSEIVAIQLEKRIPFRRAMKMIVQSALKAGAEGIQVKCSGRLGGVEIARSEWYQKGRMPLHTIRAKIDYHFTEANTIYGKIGIKVWVNLGESIEEEGNDDDNNDFESRPHHKKGR